MRGELHEMRQFVKMAAAAANGELRDAILALERDLEVVKKKLNGGLLACLGADAPSVAGMARQQDLLEVSNSVGTKVDRGELQARPRLIFACLSSVLALNIEEVGHTCWMLEVYLLGI